MMISPEMFLTMHKDMKYQDLLHVRDELIGWTREFESKSYDPEENNFHPSPEVRYQMNLQYLGKLCELISEKYNEEYI